MQIIESRENRPFAYEMKFLISTSAAAEVKSWARSRLSPDPHAEGNGGNTYRITSIYFDTPGLSVFRQEGSYARAKYRIRRYGASPSVFLERKLRAHGIVTKRRTLTPLAEMDRTEGAGRWFHRRIATRAMSPVCQISYLRMAMLGPSHEGPIRLTLDDDLRASSVSGLAFHPLSGGSLLLDGHSILEMKFRLALPALFKELLTEFRLCPQPVSKYRLAVPVLGLAATSPMEAPAVAYA